MIETALWGLSLLITATAFNYDSNTETLEIQVNG